MVKESKMIKLAGMLAGGQIGKIQLDEDDSEAIADVTMWLDGHNYFYKYTEDYEDNTVVITMLQDAEDIDAMYEDLDNLHYMGFSLEEEKFMALVAKLKYENKHEYSKFMTKGQMLNVRWDLMKYLTNANMDVYYTQGLVVIH